MTRGLVLTGRPRRGATALQRMMAAAATAWGCTTTPGALPLTEAMGSGDLWVALLGAVVRAALAAGLDQGSQAALLEPACRYVRVAREVRAAGPAEGTGGARGDGALPGISSETPEWLDSVLLVPELLEALTEGLLMASGSSRLVIPVVIPGTPTGCHTVLRALASIASHAACARLLLLVDVHRGDPASVAEGVSALPAGWHLLPVEPLAAADVWVALWEQAWHLQRDPTRDVLVPLEEGTCQRLVEVCDGDLGAFAEVLDRVAEATLCWQDDPLAPLGDTDFPELVARP